MGGDAALGHITKMCLVLLSIIVHSSIEAIGGARANISTAGQHLRHEPIANDNALLDLEVRRRETQGVLRYNAWNGEGREHRHPRNMAANELAGNTVENGSPDASKIADGAQQRKWEEWASKCLPLKASIARRPFLSSAMRLDGLSSLKGSNP